MGDRFVAVQRGFLACIKDTQTGQIVAFLGSPHRAVAELNADPRLVVNHTWEPDDPGGDS